MTNLNYYQSRINKALDFLNKNLHEDIRIEQMATAAHFSVFHFQRLYKALQGETPYETLLRLRLEKAVFLLKHQPQLKVSEVAADCEFPSVENFSRQFKARFDFSASAFKKDKVLQNSRIYQEENPEDFYSCIEESRKDGGKSFKVELEKLEAIPIAFVRAVFGADGSGLVEKYQELIAWAQSNDLPCQGELLRFGMSIDNPDVTPANKYRYDFAIKNEVVKIEAGVIESGEIPAATYATVHCIGDINEVAKAWNYLYKTWLPNSDYVPLHYPAIEEFVKGPEEIGWTNFNLKCRIPVALR